MGSADRRPERNQFATPIERLRYDMRPEGYFAKGVLAGQKAHTNEHIQADCVAAILEIEAKITQILARIPDRAAPDLKAPLADLEKRLKRVEARVKTFIVDNA